MDACPELVAVLSRIPRPRTIRDSGPRDYSDHPSLRSATPQHGTVRANTGRGYRGSRGETRVHDGGPEAGAGDSSPQECSGILRRDFTETARAGSRKTPRKPVAARG